MRSDAAGGIVLRVVVDCALAADMQFVAASVEYEGRFGYAPGWREGPLSPAQRELVTGCALAHLGLRDERVQVGRGISGVRYFGDLLGTAFPDEAVCTTPGMLPECATPGDQHGLTRCGLEVAGPCDQVCHGEVCTIEDRAYEAVGASL